MAQRGFIIEDEDHTLPGRIRGKNYLLVIGIDQYRHCHSLENAKRDAQAVTKVLISRYQFEESHLYELYDGDASREKIIDTLDELSEKITSQDNLLIYYAGHGYFRENLKLGYWVPADARDRRYADFINHSTIRDYIKAIPAHHTLLIVDSCFSGALLSERNLNQNLPYPDRVDQFPSRWCLAAGMIEKVSDGYIGDHSPFAKSLITYLEKNNEPRLHIRSLIDHVTLATANNADQTPIGGVILKTGDQNGQFIFDLKAAGIVVKDQSEDAFRQAEAENTTSAYTGFILQYPESRFFADALKHINKLSQTKADTPGKKSAIPFAEFVQVEGGTFMMGSNDYDDEKPVHKVRLSPFAIGKFPITQRQWSEIMGNNPSLFKDSPDCPVEQVSWNEVKKFLEKLNARYPGQNFRLPTEAEWEYAARGGRLSKGFKYAGSNNPEEAGWFDKNAKGKTHPVGQKIPNELGIYDMSGNVFEWCQDWYGSDYYKNSPKDNPKGPESGDDRVVRGGSWYRSAVRLRVYDRRYYGPDFRYDVVGFRIARTLDL
ncbi:MAG: SUMF1/EgtB/PvdO family nonheme iron enzyme [Bacteroidia bacterium]